MPLPHFLFPYLMILLLFCGQLRVIFYLKHQAVQCPQSAAERNKARKAWNRLFMAIALFLLGVSFLGMKGFFSIVSFPPRFPVIFIPSLIFMFYVIFLKVSGGLSFLKDISAAGLVVVQFYRFVLEFVVLALYRQEVVPKEITYQGRSFDILVGISSLVVGYLLYKKVPYAERVGIFFNLFGLASLVNIIFIAASSFPSPFRMFATNYLPTFFPGILIPAFIAPFALFMHILSLKQLFYKIHQKKKPILYTGA